MRVSFFSNFLGERRNTRHVCSAVL